ncbi:MAG: hypothetical protein KJ025_03275 [Burkholderiales bacterium]|nr:hypothetical protein [Burkholderiales bacterium]
MTLNQFKTVLKARKWVVLTTLAIALGAAVALSWLLPARWTATAAVLVDSKSPDPASGMLVPSQTLPGAMATQVEIIRSRKVALKVVEALRLDQSQAAQQQWRAETQGRGSLKVWLADRLVGRLDAAPARDSSVIRISYAGDDPQLAAAAANAFASAYSAANLELKDELARQSVPGPAERTQADGAAPRAPPGESLAAQTNIAVLSPAVEPIEPSFPKWPLNIALALGLGALLGVCIALVMEALDRRLRSEADVAGALGVPLLATLPHARFPRIVRRLLTHRPQGAA